MPRAPSWQPNQVAPVEITDARFRAANNNGSVAGGLAAGMQGFGDAVSGFAEAQDRLNAQNDDTQSRLMSASAQTEAEGLKSGFLQLQSGAARSGQAEAEKQLDALRDKYLQQASNPRQRRMLEERMLPVLGSARTRIAEHSIQQQKVERTAGFKAQEFAAGQSASAADTPQERDIWIGKAVDARFALLRDQGFTPEDNPEVYGVARIEAASAIHANVLDGLFADPDPKLDEIASYAEAYSPEMTAGLQNDVFKRLQAPLQGRIDRGRADTVMGLLGPTPTTDGQSAGAPSAVAMLRDFEGFRESTYWDVNHHRVGYGSDTITTASGEVRTVRKGDRVDRASAERDLARRTAALENAAAKKAGAGWRSLPEGARAAVVSVAYNYGEEHSRLAPLWEAARRGDAGGVADVITGFADDNGGVNRSRRMREAAAAAGGAAYNSGPREWDRATVHARLQEQADREDWTPEATERVRDEIDRRINADEKLLGERYGDAADEATRIIAGMPDGLQSISQLPRAVRDRMDPTDVAKLEQGIREQRKAVAKEATEAANARAKLELDIERRLEPEKFKQRNLLEMAGKLTPAELTSQFIAQQEMKTKPVAADPYRTGIQSAITWAEKYDQVEIEEQDFPGVYDVAKKYLTDLKRPATDKDYSDAIRHAMTTTVPTFRSSLFGGDYQSGTKPLYKVTEVPANFRAQFTRNFGGGKPSEAQILEGYRRWLDR